MRTLHVDWERIAGQMIAIAHMALGHDPKWEVVALVEGLKQDSTEFAGWWDDQSARWASRRRPWKTIFAANCPSCHRATGADGGGGGPSLSNEKSRKNQAAAVAWIKNPQPPMPKLYPSPLSEKDVSDVAAYVESL